MFKGTHWSKMPNHEEIRQRIATSHKGKKLSLKLRKKWSKVAKKYSFGKWMKGRYGEQSNYYKGGKAGYGALHMWVRYHLGKPKKCVNGHTASKYVWGNKSGKYKRDLSDWHELCQSCNLTDGIKKHKKFKHT